MTFSKFKIFACSILSFVIFVCVFISAGLFLGWFDYTSYNVGEDTLDKSDNNLIVSDVGGDLITINRVKGLTAGTYSAPEVLSTAVVSATLSDDIADEEITFTLSWSDSFVDDNLAEYVTINSSYYAEEAGLTNTAYSGEELTIYCYSDFSNQVILTASVTVDGFTYSSECTIDYLQRVTAVDLSSSGVGGSGDNSLTTDSTLTDDISFTYGTGSLQDEISDIAITISFSDDVKSVLEDYFGVTDWTYSWDMSSSVTMDDLFADIYGISVDDFSLLYKSEIYSVLSGYFDAGISIFSITFLFESLFLDETYSLSYDCLFDESGYALTDVENYLTFTGGDDFTALLLYSVDEVGVNVFISDDAETWYLWDGEEYEVTDSTVYLCGYDNSSYALYDEDEYDLYYCSFGGNFTEVSGNVMTLLDYVDPDNTTLSDFSFYYLFECCELLVTAPELPASSLALGCYCGMFSGCTSLVNAPELPATSLAEGCYNYMFDYCQSLIVAPELPTTSLASYCYCGMFNGCTSLVDAPELPATVLMDYCYDSMFSGCTSLVNAPELPATSLAEGCYNYMFSSCQSLESVILLDGLRDIFFGMFQNCTSLTSIDIPESVTSIGSSAFQNCTSLTSIDIPESVTSIGSSAFSSCSSLVSIDIPESVTSISSNMFQNCTSLTSVTV